MPYSDGRTFCLATRRVRRFCGTFSALMAPHAGLHCKVILKEVAQLSRLDGRHGWLSFLLQQKELYKCTCSQGLTQPQQEDFKDVTRTHEESGITR